MRLLFFIGLSVSAFFLVSIAGRGEAGSNKGAQLPTTNSFDPKLGELILAKFSAAPFPHSSRAEGHRYKTNFFAANKHYQDSTVAIFIPKNFVSTGKIDFVVHFHGWKNNVTNVLRQYELPEQLAASGKNAILIVPQGPRDAQDSSGGKLEDTNGFKNFMEEVMATLRKKDSFKNAQIGKIILSGHSGGYHVISSILDGGGLTENVKEVWLFDALYGRSDKFRNWFEHSDSRFIALYTEHGGTKTETENLIAALKHEGKSFLADQESKITEQQLRENRLIFLFTDLPHDEVLNRRKTFFKFLETSGLADFKKIVVVRNPFA